MFGWIRGLGTGIRGGFLRAGRGYSAAGMLRQFKNWVTSWGSPDGEIVADLPTLRSRARDLHKNNAIARAAEEMLIKNVVGRGLKMQVALDYEAIARELGISTEEAEAVADKFEQQAEARWYEYFDSVECDARGVANGAEKTRLAFSSVLQSGDVFATFPIRDGVVKLGLIEADQVQNPRGSFDNKHLRAGIVVDDDGAPLGYWVNKNQEQWPEQMEYVPKKGEVSGRPLMVHLFREERPGQNRGVPWVAPVMETLKNADSYKKSELTAALVASYLTVFVKTAQGVTSNVLPDDDKEREELGPDFKMGPAAILELPEGKEIQIADGKRPNPNTMQFLEGMWKESGAALGVPFEVLLSYYLTSFTSARAARIEFWKTVKLWREWLIDHFLRPLYLEWLTNEIIAGRVEAPGFFASPVLRRAWIGTKWFGEALGQINEKIEGDAILARIAMGGNTATAEYAEAYGTDYEENVRGLKREEKFRKKHNVRLTIDNEVKGQPKAEPGAAGENLPPDDPNYGQPPGEKAHALSDSRA